MGERDGRQATERAGRTQEGLIYVAPLGCSEQGRQEMRRVRSRLDPEWEEAIENDFSCGLDRLRNPLRPYLYAEECEA